MTGPPGAAGRGAANRAGLMRLVIAVLLGIVGADAAAGGRWLSAAACAAFAGLAAMLAYSTLPGRRALPRAALLGSLLLGAILWAASLLFPDV